MTEIYYARPVASPLSQVGNIAKACAAYGVDAPTRTADITQAVRDGEKKVQKVAQELARDAFTSTEDPDTWLARALDEIRDAQAREALAKAFSATFAQNLRVVMPTLVAEASTRLEPAVNKAAKALSTAASKLPAGEHAIDVAANLKSDTGGQLTKVREGLERLAIAAGIYIPASHDQYIAPSLHGVLPVVAFPNAVVEEIDRGAIGDKPRTTNEAALAGTRTIRAIDRDIKKHGVDLVLVNIAQGQYEGTSLKFVDSDELEDRTANVKRAFTRQSV